MLMGICKFHVQTGKQRITRIRPPYRNEDIISACSLVQVPWHQLPSAPGECSEGLAICRINGADLSKGCEDAVIFKIQQIIQPDVFCAAATAYIQIGGYAVIGPPGHQVNIWICNIVPEQDLYVEYA